MLKKVKSGEYAKEWAEEEKTGRQTLKKLWDNLLKHPIQSRKSICKRLNRPPIRYDW